MRPVNNTLTHIYLSHFAAFRCFLTRINIISPSFPQQHLIRKIVRKKSPPAACLWRRQSCHLHLLPVNPVTSAAFSPAHGRKSAASWCVCKMLEFFNKCAFVLLSVIPTTEEPVKHNDYYYCCCCRVVALVAIIGLVLALITWMINPAIINLIDVN